jgi:hypothetical protein
MAWRYSLGVSLALCLVLIMAANTSASSSTHLRESPLAGRQGDAAPQVVAIKTGFTADSGGGPGAEIVYGAILKNRSPTYDAVEATATISAVDIHGRSVATDQIDITVIPSGGTFAIGGYMVSNVSLRVRQLKVTVSVGRRARGLRLPPVGHVKLDTSQGVLDVSGRLTNPYRGSISETAPIYGVFLTAQGRIIGGTSDLTGAAVRPRATVDFSLQGTIYPGPKVTTVRVSVDPCDSLDWETPACAPLPHS